MGWILPRNLVHEPLVEVTEAVKMYFIFYAWNWNAAFQEFPAPYVHCDDGFSIASSTSLHQVSNAHYALNDCASAEVQSNFLRERLEVHKGSENRNNASQASVPSLDILDLLRSRSPRALYITELLTDARLSSFSSREMESRGRRGCRGIGICILSKL